MVKTLSSNEVTGTLHENTRTCGFCGQDEKRGLFPSPLQMQESCAQSGSIQVAFGTVSPPCGVCREPGWAGIAMTPQQGTLAMVRQHARDLSIFDGDTLVRTLHMANVPGALTLLAPGAIGGTDTSLCAIAEGHQVRVP